MTRLKRRRTRCHYSKASKAVGRKGAERVGGRNTTQGSIIESSIEALAR